MSDKKNLSEHPEHEHHVVSDSTYFKVFLGLILGTIITVAASYVDFGSMNMMIAMLIATIKAMMVMLIFMGLKYDGHENKVTFFGSFFFLLIFFVLTGSDMFHRDGQKKAQIDSSDLVAAPESVDVQKIRFPTPALLEKGKAVYAQNCATCHGAGGLGDGPAAAALNPKPRNFTTNEWKQGGSPAKIVMTLNKGIPGTPMPGFPTLSAEDKFALAHYVRSFVANPPSTDEDTPAVIAALEIGKAAKPRISIEKAMTKLAVPE